MKQLIVRGAAALAVLIYVTTVAATPAAAYIDPGSSSYIFQLLIGGLMGLGIAVGSFWHRIKAFFGKSSEGTGTGDTER